MQSTGRRGRDRLVSGFTITCAISTYRTKAVSSNPAHGEVCSIQHKGIKFVSDLPQVGGIFRVIKLTATI